jgi:predicted nucleotidyltransferase
MLTLAYVILLWEGELSSLFVSYGAHDFETASVAALLLILRVGHVSSREADARKAMILHIRSPEHIKSKRAPAVSAIGRSRGESCFVYDNSAIQSVRR